MLNGVGQKEPADAFMFSTAVALSVVLRGVDRLDGSGWLD
jgi:hypothetical protein